MLKAKDKNHQLKRVRFTADYQFGKGAGSALFPLDCEFKLSNTKRIRQVLQDGTRLATVRAKDGMLTLSMLGASRLHSFFKPPVLRVTVNSDAEPFIRNGKNAFARHVVSVDPGIRAGDEVLIVNEHDLLLATGKTKLSPAEMLSAKRGVAVEIRSGIESDKEKEDD